MINRKGFNHKSLINNMAKYYLIGETHGTNESPEACLDILKKHKIMQLALEFPYTQQKEIDEFLLGKRSIDELSIFQVDDTHDGRASPAVKNLLLRAKERQIRIKLVDIDDESQVNQRDKYMAQNLMEIKGEVGFLCGNVHASKEVLKLGGKTIQTS